MVQNRLTGNGSDVLVDMETCSPVYAQVLHLASQSGPFRTRSGAMRTSIQ